MKKFYFKYLNGLVLFIVALTITIPLSTLAIVYTVVKYFLIGRARDINNYFLNNAISVDMTGNAIVGKELINDVTSKKKTYRFGNKHQTASAIFGKNKRAKTLFGIDKKIADTLNAIEPNHVEKAADLDIIKE